jgi:hypothetical protein
VKPGKFGTASQLDTALPASGEAPCEALRDQAMMVANAAQDEGHEVRLFLAAEADRVLCY